jgi:hypothetical protein
MREFILNHERIEVWWNDLRAKMPKSNRKFQLWLFWWVKTHIAYYLVNELNLEEEALVLTTNLVENVHYFVWVFAENGHKVKTYLYFATMDDMVKSLQQQQFYHSLLFSHKVGLH